MKHLPGNAEAPLTAMTYNIHSCVNVFGRRRPAATARVIGALGPDLVALQEVAFLPPRNGGGPINQAEWIARRLGMHVEFFPLRPAPWGSFGLALLSRHPLTVVQKDVLPEAGGLSIRETRGALWARIDTAQGKIHVINTHLGLRQRDRKVQIRHLMGDTWLGRLKPHDRLIFCGDLNAGVYSPVYRALASRYGDVQIQAVQRGYPRRTFYSLSPFLRLDHIFVSRRLTPLSIKVPLHVEARIASDHLPVCTQLMVSAKG